MIYALLLAAATLVAGAETAAAPLSLPDLVARMQEAVPAPPFQLTTETLALDADGSMGGLTERCVITIDDGRSRLERAVADAGGFDENRLAYRDTATFNGIQYKRVRGLEGTRRTLGWQGDRDLNVDEVAQLFYGELNGRQIAGLADSPDCAVLLQADSGCYEITCADDTPRTITVDPAHGFLVKRVEHRDEDGAVVRTCEVQFQEHAGRWFPAELRVASFVDGELKPDQVVQIRPPDLQPEIRSEMFSLEFEQDTRVMPAEVSSGEIARVRNESGLETPQVESPVASTPAPPAPTSEAGTIVQEGGGSDPVQRPSGVDGATQPPHRDPVRLVVGAVLAIVAFAGCAWWWSRRR